MALSREEQEKQDRWEDEEADDLKELKRGRRGRGRSRDDEDDAPRKKRSAGPTIKTFQIWFDFNKSTVTADYEVDGDFDAYDLEEFVEGLRRDFRLYQKQEKQKYGNGNRDNYRNDRGGYSRGGGGYRERY